MENYRDYGQIGGIGLTDTPINTVRYGQVYQATHDGIKRLPYMNRSFISFTYGNKHIEDFDLLATITSNRLSRDGYASFKDNISTYDNLDGQFYWSTHYSNNIITFNLSTDGIDQKKLDNFLFWFSAGVTRELVLSEHPNRAIMARVSKPPALSLLPFESEVDINISGDVYKTSTTLYKGDITLELISDDPHWYAINNILGKKSGNRYIDYWTDANGAEVSIFASKDALKILYEDGIPLGSMIENNMILGNGAFANVEGNVESLIWSIPENQIVWTEGQPSGEGARIDTGKIFGAIVDISGNGILELLPGVNHAGYFFYAGTAPSPTIISFDLQPEFDSQGYLYSINNEVYNPNNPYNSIFIESVKTQELRLTAPSIITSYNKALNILLTEYFSTTSIPDLKEMIIEKVKHPAVRVWVNNLLDSTGKSSSITSTNIQNQMKNFWINNTNEYTPLHFTFNSKTGEAFMEYNYRKPTDSISLSYSGDIRSKSQLISVKDEDAGDMLLSNNIFIRERNYPNKNGRFLHWTNTEEGRTYSHRIYHDFPISIQNVQILYRNMYL